MLRIILTETPSMLRTLFLLGLAIIVGGFVLSLVFGIALFALAVAVKVMIIGAIAYVVIRIVSPTTAALLRSRFERRTLNRF